MWKTPGDEPVYTTIEGDINPADKSISSIEPDITTAHLYYDVGGRRRIFLYCSAS